MHVSVISTSKEGGAWLCPSEIDWIVKLAFYQSKDYPEYEFEVDSEGRLILDTSKQFRCGFWTSFGQKFTLKTMPIYYLSLVAIGDLQQWSHLMVQF